MRLQAIAGSTPAPRVPAVDPCPLPRGSDPSLSAPQTPAAPPAACEPEPVAPEPPASLKTGSFWFGNYMCTVSPQCGEATGALTPPEASLQRWLSQSHQWGCELASRPHLTGQLQRWPPFGSSKGCGWCGLGCSAPSGGSVQASLSSVQSGRPQAHPPPTAAGVLE